jgi:hypothetical protein
MNVCIYIYGEVFVTLSCLTKIVNFNQMQSHLLSSFIKYHSEVEFLGAGRHTDLQAEVKPDEPTRRL